VTNEVAAPSVERAGARWARASYRGPLGPGEARRLAECRGATRSEPARRAGPEIANASSETCSCRDQSGKTQGGAGVLQRNGSNRAENITGCSKGRISNRGMVLPCHEC
jgi:hypothetical protein